MIRVAAIGDTHYAEDTRGLFRPTWQHLAGEADVLLFAGDLTNLGTVEQARGFAEELRALDVPVVLVRQGGHLYAMAERCAHLGGPLSEGAIEGGAIECPWHDSKYALEDGRVLGGPSTHPQPPYECRIRGGMVEIRARREQPAETDMEARRRAG